MNEQLVRVNQGRVSTSVTAAQFLHERRISSPGVVWGAPYAFDALLADYPASRLLTRREIAPDDIAISFPIRDTTGAPSCVPLTHGALLYTAWVLRPRDDAHPRGGAPPGSLALVPGVVASGWLIGHLG